MSHTHFCYSHFTLQTGPVDDAVNATITEIVDIISHSNRTEIDLERIVGSIEGLASALSIVVIRNEVSYLPSV